MISISTLLLPFLTPCYPFATLTLSYPLLPICYSLLPFGILCFYFAKQLTSNKNHYRLDNFSLIISMKEPN